MASFGVMMALVLAIGIGGLTGVGRLQSAMNQTVNVAAKRTLLANQIVSEAANMVALERGIVLRSILQQAQVVEKHKQEFRDSSAKVERALAQLDPLLESDSSRRGLNVLRSQMAALSQAHQEMIDALNRQQFDIVQKTSEEKVMPRALEISAGAERFLAAESRNMSESSRSAQSTMGGASAGKPMSFIPSRASANYGYRSRRSTRLTRAASASMTGSR
jgi:hypothetical protein